MAMNRTIFLKSLTCLAISATLLSCQDHLSTPTGPQRFRLKRVIVTSGLADSGILPTTTTLSYNGVGKLASYVVVVGSTQDLQATLQYDDQGRLVSRQGRNSAGNLVNSAMFESDAGGNVVAIRTYLYPNQGGTPVLNTTTQIEYNADRLPGKITTIFINGVTNVTSYTYSNGNIVAVMPTVAEPLYVYDDKPNPYYGLIGLDVDLFDLINRNNRIRGSQFYTYEYNSNGLLTKVVLNRGPLPTTTYEYETY